jgi:flagellar hook-associated protein 3 FlgL
MRISTAYQFDTYAQEIDLAYQNYMDAQTEVTTGKRINKLSDDPFGAATALNLNSMQAALTQYNSNLQTAKEVLSDSENALGNTHTLLQSAYELAVSAANSTTTQSARDAMVTQVGEMETQLLGYANTQGPSNEYVFAGQSNSSEPFTVTSDPGTNAVQLATGDYLNFNGDNLDVTVQTGATQTMTVNTKGQTLFTQAYQALDQLKSDLQNGDVSSLSSVDIQSLQDSMTQMSDAEGYAGTQLQTVSSMTDNYTQQIDNLTSDVSNIVNVDMAQAIEKYATAQTAYQAALSVVSQGYQYSLVNFISGTAT